MEEDNSQGKNVTSFEYLIAIATNKTVKSLTEDEVQLLLENPMTGKRRKQVMKKDELQLDYQFRLKPQIHEDPDNDDGGGEAA